MKDVYVKLIILCRMKDHSGASNDWTVWDEAILSTSGPFY